MKPIQTVSLGIAVNYEVFDRVFGVELFGQLN